MPKIVILVLMLCPIVCALITMAYTFDKSRLKGKSPSKLHYALSALFGIMAGILMDAFTLGLLDEILGFTDWTP